MGRWCVKLLNFSLNCWTRLNHCNPRYLSHHFHLDHRQECNPIGVIRPVCTNGRSPRHPRNPKGPPWRLGMAGYDWVLHIVFFFPQIVIPSYTVHISGIRIHEAKKSSAILGEFPHTNSPSFTEILRFRGRQWGREGRVVSLKGS